MSLTRSKYILTHVVLKISCARTGGSEEKNWLTACAISKKKKKKKREGMQVQLCQY